MIPLFISGCELPEWILLHPSITPSFYEGCISGVLIIIQQHIKDGDSTA